ncbi:hypothetical protein NKG94_23340 [Micromonospora sp. M12]
MPRSPATGSTWIGWSTTPRRPTGLPGRGRRSAAHRGAVGDAPQTVKRVNVSAMLRPALTGDADTGAQNALSALRSFAVSACNATTTDCADPTRWQRIYTSAGDAFPGGAYRAYSRDINLRTFAVPSTLATHLRLEVLASQ